MSTVQNRLRQYYKKTTGNEYKTGDLLNKYYTNTETEQKDFTDREYDTLKALEKYALVENRLNEQKQNAESSAANIYSKMEKYLPTQQKINSANGLGSSSAALHMYNTYQNKVGDINKTYQDNLLSNYLNSIEEENSIRKEYDDIDEQKLQEKQDTNYQSIINGRNINLDDVEARRAAGDISDAHAQALTSAVQQGTYDKISETMAYDDSADTEDKLNKISNALTALEYNRSYLSKTDFDNLLAEIEKKIDITKNNANDDGWYTINLDGEKYEQEHVHRDDKIDTENPTGEEGVYLKNLNNNISIAKYGNNFYRKIIENGKSVWYKIDGLGNGTEKTAFTIYAKLQYLKYGNKN